MAGGIGYECSSDIFLAYVTAEVKATRTSLGPSWGDNIRNYISYTYIVGFIEMQILRNCSQTNRTITEFIVMVKKGHLDIFCGKI